MYQYERIDYSGEIIAYNCGVLNWFVFLWVLPNRLRNFPITTGFMSVEEPLSGLQFELRHTRALTHVFQMLHENTHTSIFIFSWTAFQLKLYLCFHFLANKKTPAIWTCKCENVFKPSFKRRVLNLFFYFMCKSRSQFCCEKKCKIPRGKKDKSQKQILFFLDWNAENVFSEGA